MQGPDHLREMIEVISGELELRPLLTTIVQKACELLNAQRGSIGLVDDSAATVRIEAAYRMPPEELGAVHARGDGLAGSVFETGAPVILTRYGDLRTPQIEGVDEDAVVGMPIKWRGKIIGTFGIGADHGRRFSREDLETLELFARHAAIAINNARSYEREKRRAVRLRAANIIGESALERDPVKIVAVAETALRTALDMKCRVLRKRDDLPEGAQILPLRFEVGDYDRLAVIAGGEISLEDRQSLEALASQLGLALERARLLAESERQLEEIRLLYETSKRASTAMDLKSVVSAYLSYVAARDRFRCEIGLIEPDEKGREGLTVIGRWTQRAGVSHDPTHYTADDLGIEKDFSGFDLLLSANVHEDRGIKPALRDVLRKEGGVALAAFPLVAQGERIGLIVLSSGETHEWTENDIRPYRTTGALLASIIKNRLDYRRYLHNEHRLASLAERRLLARELHDSVSQLIFSMTLMAQAVSAGFEKSPEEGANRVTRLLDIAQLARSEMKALLAELKDPEGEESGSLASLARSAGLVPALERHRAIAGPHGVEIAISLDETARLSGDQREACLRMAQEAIANAARHGEAKRVEITLRAASGGLIFAVDDDGGGFAAASEAGSTRIGLDSMRRRMDAVGGVLTIGASRLGGARVEVLLPIQ